jgi:hypothetical protein
MLVIILRTLLQKIQNRQNRYFRYQRLRHRHQYLLRQL